MPVTFREYRPGEEGQREAFTIQKARDKLGYNPRVFAEEAIDRTATWVRKLAS